MYYITPQDCVKILKVKSINDIKIPMLRSIAELERSFAKNYYNDDSDRSDEDRENNVVNGKFGELVVMISLALSGFVIDRGVQFSDSNSSEPDDGIDLKVHQPSNKTKDIQVKYCSGKYLNFKTDRQESKVRENLKNDCIVIVCHYCLKGGHWKHILRRLDNNIFEESLRPSNEIGTYILAYDIPEFDGKL